MPGFASLIYAELLSNIRQVSVIAALDVPCDATTKVELTGGGQQFVLYHGGESNTLNLPGTVSQNAQLQKPAVGSKELSWRLPLAGPPTRPDAEDAQSKEAPWSAKTLGKESEFLCRYCGVVVIDQAAIKTWKDLPSENWAEMMDFWHCHKPDVPEHERAHNLGSNGTNSHNGHDHAENVVATAKGYGANTKFAANSGVAFVDTTTFLVTSADCTNLIPLESHTNLSANQNFRPMCCKHCSKSIGYIDHQSDGVKIWKWSIKLSPSTPLNSSGPDLPQTPSISSVIAAQISSILQAQCCSRLLLLPLGWKLRSVDSNTPDTSSPLLSFWVLTPTLRYSSTSHSTSIQAPLTSGTLAMKVFWKSVSEQEADKLMNTAEEVPLPSEAIEEVSNTLHKSALMLPPSARKFQGWDVGLLERWEG